MKRSRPIIGHIYCIKHACRVAKDEGEELYCTGLLKVEELRKDDVVVVLKLTEPTMYGTKCKVLTSCGNVGWLWVDYFLERST